MCRWWLNESSISIGRLSSFFLHIFSSSFSSIYFNIYTHLLNVFLSFSQKYRIDYIQFAYNKSTTFAKFIEGFCFFFSIIFHFLFYSNISSIYFIFFITFLYLQLIVIVDFFFFSFNTYMLCHCQWLHWLKLVSVFFFHRIQRKKMISSL